MVIKNAVCLHEEDHGLSWKHVDVRPFGAWRLDLLSQLSTPVLSFVCSLQGQLRTRSLLATWLLPEDWRVFLCTCGCADLHLLSACAVQDRVR